MGELFDEDYGSFWSASANYSVRMLVVPTNKRVTATIQNSGLIFRQRTGANENRTGRAPPMETSEFKRLMPILVQREEASSALIRSGLDLTRHEKQRREGCDTFWDTIVEPVFNEIQVWVSLGPTGCVNNENGVGTIAFNKPVRRPRGERS